MNKLLSKLKAKAAIRRHARDIDPKRIDSRGGTVTIRIKDPACGDDIERQAAQGISRDFGNVLITGDGATYWEVWYRRSPLSLGGAAEWDDATA